MPRTLYDKIWDEHVVHTEDDGTSVLYTLTPLLRVMGQPIIFNLK